MRWIDERLVCSIGALQSGMGVSGELYLGLWKQQTGSGTLDRILDMFTNRTGLSHAYMHTHFKAIPVHGGYFDIKDLPRYSGPTISQSDLQGSIRQATYPSQFMAEVIRSTFVGSDLVGFSDVRALSWTVSGISGPGSLCAKRWNRSSSSGTASCAAERFGVSHSTARIEKEARSREGAKASDCMALDASSFLFHCSCIGTFGFKILSPVNKLVVLTPLTLCEPRMGVVYGRPDVSYPTCF